MFSKQIVVTFLTVSLGVVLLGCSQPIVLDTDGDGWSDGDLNTRLRVTLIRIEVFHTEDNVGEDELYLLVDGKRFPKLDPSCSDLCGVWSVKENNSSALTGGNGCSGTKSDLSCNLVIAERALGYRHFNDGGVVPLVHVQVLDDDDDLFPPSPGSPSAGPNKHAADWQQSDDDLLGDFILRLEGANLTDSNPATSVMITQNVTKNSASYRLTFRIEDLRFSDPVPTSDGDPDGDGLKESEEAALSRQFGGIADPSVRDVFLEADVVSPSGGGIDQTTIDLLTTQFFNHGIALHMDANGTLAGYPGQSEIINNLEAASLVHFSKGNGFPTVMDYRDGNNGKSRHFDSSRAHTFHYALFVDDLEETDDQGNTMEVFGMTEGSTLGIQKKLLGIDFLYDYQVLTVMHELGHSLGLCHPRDVRSSVPGCTHYAVPASVATNDLDGATAMGTPQGGEAIFVLQNATVRPVDYFAEEWAALDLKSALGR